MEKNLTEFRQPLIPKIVYAILTALCHLSRGGSPIGAAVLQHPQSFP